MRLFRRKAAETPPDSTPDPALAEELIEANTTASYADQADAAAPELPRRQPVRRRLLPVRFGALLLVLALIVIGVALLLYQQNALPPEVLLWWPLALIVPGALWFLIALVRRSGRGLLGSAAVIGAGMSLLLGAQTINSVSSTLVGIMLISIGTSIVLRGLLMGRQPIGIDQ
jgi:peptidoglycan/LPS O-acetylase OafA/YrhL